MSFFDTVRRAKNYLEEQGRVSTRALQRRFDVADDALEELERQPAHQECRGALDRALALADRGGSGPGDLSSLGSGRAAHEALAVALLCALAAPDFETALRLAVSGDGESSTAAAVGGSLLGAAGGEDVIPRRWLERLELRDAIERTADELGTLV